MPIDDVEPTVRVADAGGGREMQACRLDVHVQITPHTAQSSLSGSSCGVVRAGVATVAPLRLPYCPA
ncbi:hypothetical protein TPB0596_22760 [Tsukamurella pulmonis]|nr:hypothetical protein TPB0596_22760 [Tsukamurella pulmonis]